MLAARLLYIVSIAMLPVSGIPILLAGQRVFPVYLPLLCFCILRISLPSTLGRILTLLKSAPLYWGSLGLYLAYLWTYSVVTPSDTSKHFFAAKLALVLASLFIADYTQELFSKRELERTVKQVGGLSCLLLLLTTLLGVRNAGLNPSSLFAPLLAFDFSAYGRLIQTILSGAAASESPEDTQLSAAVLKNTVAEGAGLSLLLILTTVRKQNATTIAVGSILLIAITLLLSRSVFVFFFLSALWLSLPNIFRNLIPTAIFVGFAFAAGLLIYHRTDAATAASEFQSNRHTSNEIRMEQYRNAMLHRHRSAINIWLGDGPTTKYEGLRIHNLLLSSWVEGGVFLLVVIMIHYYSILASVITAFPFAFQNAQPVRYSACAIPVLAVLRTLTNGGGGIYTTGALIAMAVYWGVVVIPDLATSYAFSISFNDDDNALPP